MDDLAADIIDREAMLADFDHARDDFENAFAQVPDEALDFKQEGDDYSIADLLPHITGSIVRYSRQFDLMKEIEYQELRIVAGAEEAELIESHRQAREDPTRKQGDRQTALNEMEAAHDELAAKLREVAYEEYTRLSTVYYPGSDAPYPTRPADLTRWLADHYREHVPHVMELLASWKMLNA
jgi:DinB superfamily